MFRLMFFGAFWIAAQALAAEPTPGPAMPLIEVLRNAESFNPRLKGARFHEQALAENIRAQSSSYYPDLSVAAVASTGDPGSFSLLDVDSNISSAQRVGWGGALVLKQDLWDFGRTSGAVHTAEAQRLMQQKEFSVIKMDVDREVLRTYVHCSFLRAQVENSQFMADQAHLMAEETTRFVRSGQRSVVERYLVDAEAKEAETRIAEFTARVGVIEQRLAIALGRPHSESIHCSSLAQVHDSLAAIERTSSENPILAAQKVRIQVARSKLDRARAESRPALVGMATGGYFDNSHTRERMNYAAGIGIKIPLFEGFRIDSNINAETAELNSEEAGLDNSRLSVDNANSRYDEQIESLKVRLEFLEKEKSLAREVFTLARKRYRSLQGTMIDLRESIRNMNRVLQSTDEAYRDIYTARGERSLLNGANF